ncbi:MipA/OmpV family protein [Roseomonas sp. AR75]|uniref:MipA/OmpV family protein n=1 Tax=Roseomonas sp. AR75 TaxID=2562311 RepID=UPI0010C142A3|nr:MipA/OmpV family protein [Roseomonas sp. AR75]
MNRLLRGLAALLPCLLAAPALAQTGLAPQAAPAFGQPQQDRWRVGLGVGALFSPDYLGSNDFIVRPLASPDIRSPNDTFFLSFRDGLGTTLLRDGGFSAGLVLKPRFGRDQDDNPALAGMGDIGISGEGGAFVSYGTREWLARGEVRQAFGGYSGVVAEARLDRIFRPRQDLILSAGPRLSWGNSGFAEAWFGVDPSQSQTSGYAVFTPNDYWFAALAGGATYVINDRWALIAFGEVGRILGDSADSPLVQRGSATQGVVGLTVAYRFWP